MKILHVISTLSLRYGGPREAILELCRSLRTAGLDVEICTTDSDGQGRLPVELGRRTFYEGVPCYFFRRSYSERFKYSRPLKSWVDENIRQYDLVHIHGVFSYVTYAVANACWRAGVSYIVRPYGTLEPWCMRQKPVRKIVAWRLGFRRVMQRAIMIHYTTDQERTLTESSLGLCRGTVVPNGVPETLLQYRCSNRFRQRIGIPEESSFLLILSRIHPKKGIDLLLEAFVELKAHGQLLGWHLVVAGDGEADYVKKLRALTNQTAAEPFVHWVGWLQGESRWEAHSEAGLFVLTSFAENFGVAVAEAMACATPVLISRQVGLAAEVTKVGAGWVVDIPDGLQQGLLEATQSLTELHNRGSAARALMQDRFTWPKIAKTWAARYEELAGANANGGVELGEPARVCGESV